MQECKAISFYTGTHGDQCRISKNICTSTGEYQSSAEIDIPGRLTEKMTDSAKNHKGPKIVEKLSIRIRQ